MRTPRLSLVALALVGLAGCESTTAPAAAPTLAPDRAALDVASAPSLPVASNHYVIVASSNGLPADLPEQIAAAGATLTGTTPEIGVAFATSEDPDFARHIKGVQFVGPDLLINAPDEVTAPVSEMPADLSGVDGAGDDEPYFPLQWGMRAIHAPQAWDAGVRGQGVVVAVIDEGFYLDHPDVSFMADDAVSFACWRSVIIDGEAYLYFAEPPYCEPAQFGTGYDLFSPISSNAMSHGTHTSGIIAARDNGLGVIGVAPDAQILPIKVLSEYLGGGYTSWIIQGILYAADAGVDVINMSLGGTATIGGQGTDDVMLASVVAYRRALDYARRQGVTVVVSAGNDGLDADGDGRHWIRPAEFEAPLTVSATGPDGIYYDPDTNVDVPASYTNSGKSLVDFAAPGGDFELYPNPAYVYDMVISAGSATGYYWAAGTSMAAPHAAGIAALIISENGGPMSPTRVEAEMRKRATDLGMPGNDDFFGHGRVSSGY